MLVAKVLHKRTFAKDVAELVEGGDGIVSGGFDGNRRKLYRPIWAVQHAFTVAGRAQRPRTRGTDNL
jgi:hypothetical protein